MGRVHSRPAYLSPPVLRITRVDFGENPWRRGLVAWHPSGSRGRHPSNWDLSTRRIRGPDQSGMPKGGMTGDPTQNAGQGGGDVRSVIALSFLKNE
jgi:hypothetical protein